MQVPVLGLGSNTQDLIPQGRARSDWLLPPQKALPQLRCSEGFKGQLW